MSAVMKEIAAPGPSLSDFCRAVVDDLLTLATLHDRELDRDAIHGLWEIGYEDFLALRLESDQAQDALMLFREGLTEIPTALCQETLDQLAADYADIYLNFGLRASPCESVWLDQDNLAMQGPMFAVRDCYRRHGLAVEDWRKRTDDHLVNELRFVAHLIESEEEGHIREAARFMDDHLLRWIDQFASRVAQRAATRLYAGLALVTATYLDELRDLLALLLEEPRPSAEALDAPLDAESAASIPVEGPYLPGVAPSW
jgi:TorA maturation chaperone TorD